jgi:hypothetical protein
MGVNFQSVQDLSSLHYRSMLPTGRKFGAITHRDEEFFLEMVYKITVQFLRLTISRGL